VEGDAIGFGLGLAAILGGDDGDPFRLDIEVPQQQGQNPLADAPEADDDEAAGEINAWGGRGH
jgi:hypothetical protein